MIIKAIFDIIKLILKINQKGRYIMSDNIKEECGVFGIYDKSRLGNIAQQIYVGLFALQHRGQEAEGIAVNNDREITLVKNM